MDDERTDRPFGQQGCHEGRNVIHRRRDQVHERWGKPEDRGKHPEHDPDEDQRAPDAVREQGVDAILHKRRRAAPADHAVEQPLDRRVAGDRLGLGSRPQGRAGFWRRELQGPWRRPASGVHHSVADGRDALARRRRDPDDRASETPREFGDVDPDSFSVGDVGQRERDDHGYADFQRLRGQEHVPRQVGGISHDKNAVRTRDTRHATVEDVNRHPLVRALRREAVGTGQVNEIDRSPAVREAADLLLDRDAGIVADPGGNAR